MTTEPQRGGVGELQGCPFCGTAPTIQPWHGGPKSKRMIACDNDDCGVRPCVSGNTRKEAVTAWNTRAASPVKVESGEAVSDEWRVMSTAPIDGTEILAAIRVFDTRGGFSHWDRHVVAFNDAIGSVSNETDQGWRWEDYECWCPIPATPVIALSTRRPDDRVNSGTDSGKEET